MAHLETFASGPWRWPGLALAVLLMGCSLGLWALRLRGRSRTAAALVCGVVGAIISMWWFLSASFGVWACAIGAALAAPAMLCFLAAGMARPGVCISGVVVGFGLCLGGFVGAGSGFPFHADLALLLAAHAVAVWGFFRPGPAPPTVPPDSAACDSDVGARLFLAGGAGAAGAAMLGAMFSVSGSFAYATAGVAPMFLLGMLVFARCLSGHWRGGGALVAGGACVAAASLVSGYSFLLYPDLILSGPAATQLSPYLLTTGRTFPLYGLALLLGLGSGPAWTRASRRGISLALAAAAAGAAVAGLLSGSDRAPFLLISVLCMATVLPVARRLCRRAAGRNIVLPAGGCLMIALIALFALTADPHAGGLGLRMSLAHVASAVGREIAPDEVTVALADATGSARRVECIAGELRGTFLNGGLAAFTCPGRAVEPSGRTAAIALVLGLSRRADKVAVIAPALPETLSSARVLAGGAAVHAVNPWQGGPAAQYDAIICGPGPLGAANPLLVVSREGLARIAARLDTGGAFALWLPAGTMQPMTLRRCVATFRSVFPAFSVFVIGDECVLVASKSARWDYARLAAVCARSNARALLECEGPWPPLQILAGFAGGADDVGQIADGVAPYALAALPRPPLMSLDLARPAGPYGLALLVQYRLAGPDRLIQRIEFANRRRRAAALHGFTDAYAEQTRAALRGIGRLSGPCGERLTDFVEGPLARLDLLAPGAEQRAARMSAALAAFGLPQAAMAVLEGAVEAGQGSFEVHMMLARRMEAVGEPHRALVHYREALKYNPDSAEVRRRIIELQRRGRPGALQPGGGEPGRTPRGDP